MNTKTRLLAFLISIVMLVASFPIITLTASATGTNEVAVSGTGLEALNKEYATFQEAWDAVEEVRSTVKTGEVTFTLLTDCQAPKPTNARGLQPFWKVHTKIDLNGHVLTPSDTAQDGTDANGKQRIFYVDNNRKLTIMDSNPTAVHKYSVDATTGLYQLDEANGTVSIPGGVITGGYGESDSLGGRTGGGAIFACGSLVDIKGGNLIGNQGGAICLDQEQNMAATLKISGNTKIIGNYDSASTKCVTIKGSHFWGVNGVFFDGRSSITGGIFDAEVDKGFIPEGYGVAENTATGFNEVKMTGNVVFHGVQRSAGAAAPYSLRLIASVKKSVITADNTFAGFTVQIGDARADFAVDKYFTKLLAQDENNEAAGMVEITPDGDEYVLIAVVLENFPAITGDLDLTVTPYIRQGEEAPVTGASVTVKLTNNQIAGLNWVF